MAHAAIVARVVIRRISLLVNDNRPGRGRKRKRPRRAAPHRRGISRIARRDLSPGPFPVGMGGITDSSRGSASATSSIRLAGTIRLTTRRSSACTTRESSARSNMAAKLWKTSSNATRSPSTTTRRPFSHFQTAQVERRIQPVTLSLDSAAEKHGMFDASPPRDSACASDHASSDNGSLRSTRQERPGSMFSGTGLDELWACPSLAAAVTSTAEHLKVGKIVTTPCSCLDKRTIVRDRGLRPARESSIDRDIGPPRWPYGEDSCRQQVSYRRVATHLFRQSFLMHCNSLAVPGGAPASLRRDSFDDRAPLWRVAESRLKVDRGSALS